MLTTLKPPCWCTQYPVDVNHAQKYSTEGFPTLPGGLDLSAPRYVCTSCDVCVLFLRLPFNLFLVIIYTVCSRSTEMTMTGGLGLSHLALPWPEITSSQVHVVELSGTPPTPSQSSFPVAEPIKTRAVQHERGTQNAYSAQDLHTSRAFHVKYNLDLLDCANY